MVGRVGDSRLFREGLKLGVDKPTKEAFKQLPRGWVRSLVPRLESAWPPRVLAQGFSLFATLKNHWGAC